MGKIEIRKTEKSICETFLEKHHYLSKQNCGFRCGHNYGLYENGTLIGVAVFHTVSALQTVKGCFRITDQKGIYELGRFAIDSEHNNPTLASCFLTRCIYRLRKDTHVRALIGYVDNKYETGLLYQSTNFKYYGLTAKRKDFFVVEADGTLKKQSRGKTKDIVGVWKPRSRKHRYLMIFDKTLKTFWKEETYPNDTI